MPNAFPQGAMVRGAGFTVVTSLMLWFSGFANAANAQPFRGLRRRQDSIPSMTLPQALAYAHEHQPLQQAAQARVEASRADARVPRAKRFPTVGATMQLLGATENNTTAAYVGSPYVDIPRVGGTKSVGVLTPQLLMPAPSSLLALGVRQQVFDFGRVSAAADAADALVNVERQRALGVGLDVDQSVVDSYLAIHAARSVLAAAERALDRMRAHQAMGVVAVEQGLRARADLIRADAEVARMESGVVRAQGTVETTQSNFAASVGSALARLDAAGNPPTWGALPTLEQAQRAAEANEPSLVEAQARVAAARSRTDAVRAEMRPELLLTGGISTRAGGAPPSADTPLVGYGLLPYVPNGFVGLVLNWPMLDPVVLARSRAAEHQESVLQLEAAAALQRAQSRVAQAHVAALVAEDSMPALERALVAAKDNHAQVVERWQHGLGTELETADAEAFLVDAETQLALGRFQVARTRAVLDRAMGVQP